MIINDITYIKIDIDRSDGSAHYRLLQMSSFLEPWSWYGTGPSLKNPFLDSLAIFIDESAEFIKTLEHKFGNDLTPDPYQSARRLIMDSLPMQLKTPTVLIMSTLNITALGLKGKRPSQRPVISLSLPGRIKSTAIGDCFTERDERSLSFIMISLRWVKNLTRRMG